MHTYTYIHIYIYICETKYRARSATPRNTLMNKQCRKSIIGRRQFRKSIKKSVSYVKYSLINMIKCLNFFDLNHFSRLGQKSKKYFLPFFV